MGDETDKLQKLEGEVVPAASVSDWADYPERVKRQAANYYASGKYTDEAIGRAVGAPPEVVKRWRADNEPDGVDWENLRLVHESGAWLLTPKAANMTAADTAQSIMTIQGQLLAACQEALTTGVLVDERGQPVPHLWDQETGEKVPINTLARFKSFDEVGKVLRLGITAENLRDTAEERRSMEAKLMEQAGAAFKELYDAVDLTPAQEDRWRETLQGLQNEGKLPEGALLEVRFRDGENS